MTYHRVTTITGGLFFMMCMLASPVMAIEATVQCPLSHSHMGHGMNMGSDDMDMSGMHMKPGRINQLVEAECANCHGAHGMSHGRDVPNLAGQNAMYLCGWLAACRAEGKRCESHGDIATSLSDQDIADLSEYYAHMHDFTRAAGK
ncbi:MAG: hypothetical protein RIQ52_1977 [Pseudomonadota bacterium]|jgi:cytochrome c553